MLLSSLMDRWRLRTMNPAMNGWAIFKNICSQQPKKLFKLRQERHLPGMANTSRQIYIQVVLAAHEADHSPPVPANRTLRNCSRSWARPASVVSRGTRMGSPKVISQREKGSGI